MSSQSADMASLNELNESYDFMAETEQYFPAMRASSSGFHTTLSPALIPKSHARRERSVSPVLSQVIPTRMNESPNDVPEATRAGGISRTTYFRALRNLRDYKGTREKTAMPAGRPQKMDAQTDEVIRQTLAERPWTGLKELRDVLQERCGLVVSVSSISRRLKVLGLPTGAAAQTAASMQRNQATESAKTGAYSQDVDGNALLEEARIQDMASHDLQTDSPS